MTKLREIIEYIAAKPSRLCPFPELRRHFNSDLTGLRVALDRQLLELRYSCYAITPAGIEFLERVHTPDVDEKVCYQCQRTLAADKFWKNQSSVDGLFSYCITCGTRKKREAMERYQEARAAVEAAVPDLIRAARDWDEACVKLKRAWQAIMAADTVIRSCTHALKSDNDSGRMHARTTFPRAAFVLNMALAEAQYPQTVPLLREVNFPERLADYIGPAPHGDYVKLETAKIARDTGDGSETSTEESAEAGGEGPTEGRGEQGHQGTQADGARRARSSGRRGLPAKASQKAKPRSVPKTRRAVSA